MTHLQTYCITHKYDAYDQSTYFLFDADTVDPSELVAYLQFKAESYNESASLDKQSITAFLEYFGAIVLDTKPDQCKTIEMFENRESKCADWYIEKYSSYDSQYSDIANHYLQSAIKKASI